jgi:putative ABC transport system permease protein
MLKNYVKLAVRHFRKNIGYTTINIAGLATGMAIALLIGLWISDELSYNYYFPNHQRIAKGMITQDTHGESYSGDVVSMIMGRTFNEKYKNLFSRTALTCGGEDHLIAFGDKRLSESCIWAQRELPEIFGFRMLRGSTGTMNDPSTSLISQSLATALFGKDDPSGKTIRVDNQFDLKVGGVYEDIPNNADFSGVQLVMPWYNTRNDYHVKSADWDDHNGRVYVEMADNVTTEQANARIHNLPTSFIKGWDETAFVYPLDRFHLYNEFKNGKPDGGRIQFVWLFGIIGCSVLLLACINFMNLSTARSGKRAREVGIRKTVGSLKRQLVVQFLSESVLLALLAFVLAMILVEVSLPWFNTLAGKQMAMPWSSPMFWIAVCCFVLFTGILAGSYPAFYLSRFDPVRVLKGAFRAGRFASVPRHVLVVLQFTVSLTLIIGTVVVFRQIQYTKDRPVGYERAGLMTVGLNTADLYNHYDALRQELIQDGLAENVAASSMKVTDFQNNNGLTWRGKRPDQESIFFRNVNVTRDFGKTIGWHVIQGRDFSREFGADSSGIILNAATAKIVGMKNPVGEIMKFGGKNYTVVGVVGDMVTNSPYDQIMPAIFLGDGYLSTITIRLKQGKPVHELLSAMSPIFQKYNPSSPFIYQFTDAEYAHKFEAEQRIGNLATVFAGLAIFISCLGLFGLASFVAEQRTKEIGVRKVLGANVLGLWGLLSRDFVKLVFISLFIAVPIAYYGMNKWLANYVYRTPLSWWIFAASVLGLLLITLLTVSYQSLKAATANPAKSLRTE